MSLSALIVDQEYDQEVTARYVLNDNWVRTLLAVQPLQLRRPGTRGHML